MVLPEPAAQKDVVRWCRAGSERGTHVYHGSTEVTRNLLISIRYKSSLGGTNLQFPRNEHYMQCYGWWTDLVARAIDVGPVLIDSLFGCFNVNFEHECGSETTNVSCLLSCRLFVG